MRFPQFRTLALVTTLLVAACGGDSNTTGDNGNGSCTSKFSATVNGVAWCGLSPVANYYANQQQVVFTAVNLALGAPANTWSITLSASSITAAGTYTLTTLAPLRFAIAANGAGVGYTTTNTGGTGTITFTTFTTTHIVGTFSFTAPPTSGGGSSVTVTGGSFDLVLTPAN